MVVGYLDVGAWTDTSKCFCIVQGNSPIGLEDLEEKGFDPFSIFQGHCTFMAYWKKTSSELNQFTNARKRSTNSVSTFTNSLSTGPVNKKACAVKEATLDPKEGALRGWLSDNYVHFPKPSTAKQPCCALCRFVAPNKNMRTYTCVFQCEICKVHLCVTCFRPFHTNSSMKNLKLKFYLASKRR